MQGPVKEPPIFEKATEAFMEYAQKAGDTLIAWLDELGNKLGGGIVAMADKGGNMLANGVNSVTSSVSSLASNIAPSKSSQQIESPQLARSQNIEMGTPNTEIKSPSASLEGALAQANLSNEIQGADVGGASLGDLSAPTMMAQGHGQAVGGRAV